MSDYLSGRELNLKIGITSYTESSTVLEVIGKTVLGVTTTTNLTSHSLDVSGISTLGVTSLSQLTTSGPILIGTGTYIDNPNQLLQVNSGAYISGRLGIGTTNPGESLQVDGNIRVGSSSTINYIAFGGTNNDGVGPGQTPYRNTFVGERIYNLGTEQSELLLFKGTDVSSPLGPDRIRLAATGGIVFDTSSGIGVSGTFDQVGSSASLSTKMSLTSSGNFGIGTTNPVSKLDVDGPIISRNGALVLTSFNDVSLPWTNPTTSNNVDHIWHDDSNPGGIKGTWNFVSDSSYKAPGNSWLIGGGFSNSIPELGSAYPLQITGNSYISGNLGIGTTNPTTNLQVRGNTSVSGVITATQFISTAAQGNSPISVASSTLVSSLNVQYLNNNSSSYYTNASNLNAGFVPAARLFSSNDFNVFGSLYISGSLSVGGTSVVLNAQSLQIQDRDIILGITTDASSNDISSDITANHGGIAIASTVGSPLFSLALSGISSLPDTYKQMMWVRSGAFSGLGTDAFLFNYAVGVGTNQLENGVRFAAGALNVTDTIVSSGLFVGALQGNASTATTSTNLSGGARGSIPYQDSPGNTSLLTAGQTNYILLSGGPSSPPYWGVAPSAAGAFSGITIQDEGSVVGITSQISIIDFVGPNVRATANLTSTGIATITIDDYVSIAGVSTSVIGGIASVRNLNVTGPSTIGSVQFSGGIVTATTFIGNLSGTATSSTNLTGGVQGSIPFQKSSGITSFLPPDLTGLVLITKGSGQDPYWGPVSAASGSFGGITVQDESNLVGTASSISTLNFVGPRISVVGTSGANGIATITVADYVSNAGVSTNAGISTNVIGGIASVTSLSVSGISTLGTVRISSGIITAATGIITYYGDGANLINVPGVRVVTQDLVSSPVYPVLANNPGVSSVGILTTGVDALVFIPSRGYLGIGTTNPKSGLDVSGNVRISADSAAGVGTTSSASPSLTFIGLATQFNYAGVANTNAVEIKAYARDNGTLSFNGYGNQILTLNDNFDTEAFVVSNYIPKPYSFISSGLFTPTDFIEQAFRIDRAGNTIVGMGTLIGAKLDVRGSVILGVAHTSTTPQITPLAKPPHRINGDTTIFGQIRPRQQFSDLSNSPTTNHIVMSPTTGDTGSLNFFVGTSSTTRIPDQILSLTNNVAGSIFRVNNPTVGFSSATNLSIGQTFTAIFEVNSNGNVGVGTPVPNSTLHVQGNTLITGITTLGLSSSSSPTINSTMSFELTNNNTLTVRVKGTDGTVRTGTIALVP
jgi:hypothetical protein